MGIAVSVLSEKEDDPAAQVTSLWEKGSLSSAKVLESFLKRCSVVTFESEFLDAELLARIAKKTKTAVWPDPKHMAMIQDRLPQKQLLESFGLPTAPFVEVASTGDAQRAFKEFEGRLVFKKRRFGYDGNGTFVVRSRTELKKFLSRLEETPDGGDGADGFIAERFVPFEREVAVMVARSRMSETTHFPFVETFQENSRCLWVKGPLPFDDAFRDLAKRLEDFLTEIGYVGIMGVELFERSLGPGVDARRELIVNELAPRVHNSGHYSLDALAEDQFTLHLKCILGFSPADVRLHAPGFAMWNLLGTHDKKPSWRLPRDVRLHWYEKQDNRRGRKMGHLNAVAETPEAALELLRRRRSDFDV